MVDEESARSRREGTLSALRRRMVAVYFFDVLVLTVVLVLAWQLRVPLDLWSKDVATAVHLATALGPWVVLTWIVAIGVQGGPRTR